MLKRSLVVIALLLGLAVPAALAADAGAAPAGGAAAAARVARVPGHPLAALRARVRLVGRRVIRHCESATGDQLERCKDLAKQAIDRLQKIDARIDQRIAKIQERCNGSSTAPQGCDRADTRIDRLRKLQTHVRDREQKLQDWLAKVGG